LIKRKAVAIAVGLILAGGVAYGFLVWRPAFDPIEPPPANGFAAEAIAKGEVLAGVGDCVVCHTAPGGTPYAAASH